MSIVRVAEAAGVSKSTVSRVINNAPDVNPEVVRVVLEAMRKVGYQPPAVRPGPKPANRRGVRSGSVLLLAAGFSAAELYQLPAFPMVLHGVEREAGAAGMSLSLASLTPESGVPPALGAGQADGVLVMGNPEALPATVRERLKTTAAVGLFQSSFGELDTYIDRVTYDNAAVGPLAARHLIGRGHRELAFVSAYRRHPAMVRREHDFAAAAREAGARVTSIIGDFEGTLVPVEAYAGLVDRLLAVQPRVTGVMVASDYQVPGVYQMLAARGVRAGTDVEVVGCDNQPQFLGQVTPRPATIDIGLELMGRWAVKQLMWRVQNREEEHRVTVAVAPLLVGAGE